MKSDETMIPHPEAYVQNFFQVTEIIFLLGRNKITLDISLGAWRLWLPM
jgi:hypothetical protein